MREHPGHSKKNFRNRTVQNKSRAQFDSSNRARSASTKKYTWSVVTVESGTAVVSKDLRTVLPVVESVGCKGFYFILRWCLHIAVHDIPAGLAESLCNCVTKNKPLILCQPVVLEVALPFPIFSVGCFFHSLGILSLTGVGWERSQQSREHRAGRGRGSSFPLSFESAGVGVSFCNWLVEVFVKNAVNFEADIKKQNSIRMR